MGERDEPGAPFKDHFSSGAGDYARFRPRYPDALFADLAALSPGRRLAWDCATGNGQAAEGLAPHFDEVVATDASAEQVAAAPHHPRIRFAVAPAESSGLAAASVDLVTVAQALHWFDLEAFYAEVRRVCRQGGLVAVWSYGLLRLEGEVGTLIDHFYHQTIGPHWPPERRLVDAGYKGLPFPFSPVSPPAHAMATSWSLPELLGYLRTWSGVKRFETNQGFNPVARLEPELNSLWGDPAKPRDVRWPLTLRLGRVGARRVDHRFACFGDVPCDII